MGNTSKDESNVHWNKLYPMIIPRQERLAFKLNYQIYVVAGIGPVDEELCSL